MTTSAAPDADGQRPSQDPAQRREMRGPAMDLGSILGGMGGQGGGAIPFDLMRPPQIANGPSAPPPPPKRAAAAQPPPPKSVSFAQGTKRSAEDMMFDGEGDDRLSDVVSDPGSELESVPDDLSSFGGSSSSSEDDGDIRTVAVSAGRGRGRGRGGGKTAKTVITL